MGFKIIICGAGLGGLGAAIALRQKGHEVTVLEAAQQLAEIGAGIQIPPNSTRILESYGLSESIQEHVVWPNNIQFRRYSSGKVIGRTPLHPVMSDTYGTPADYQRCLYEHAVKNGVSVRMNSPVLHIDESTPSVILKDGTIMAADMIVGADGIRSKVRQAILGAEDVKPVDSSNCAYRATVPRGAMLADPEIAHLMSDINSNCWIGHQRHIMAYPIRNGEMYNLVMSHPGQAAVGKWNEPGNLAEMKQHYGEFDPTIRRVLDNVQACLKWKIADLPPLPRWRSKSGKVILIGDAAHAMVPYLAQGASMAIEDGAALAECVSRATDVNMIPSVLAIFEELRKPRCETIQAGSRSNGDIWHLQDGPKQEQRDVAMMVEMMQDKGVKAESVQNPNRWSDGEFQPWLFGHDVVCEVSAYFP
ncbi:hypothetical protein ACHAQA_003585 [Verticillium albo-atrum]